MYYKKQRILTITILLVTTLYFVGHGIIGERGLLSMFKLNQQLDTSTEKLSTLNKRQHILEKRIKGLNDEKNLDLDLLDEQARSVLGYADKGEMVLYNQQ